MLVYFNDLLSSGYIPDLYSADDKVRLLYILRLHPSYMSYGHIPDLYSAGDKATSRPHGARPHAVHLPSAPC